MKLTTKKEKNVGGLGDSFFSFFVVGDILEILGNEKYDGVGSYLPHDLKGS